MGAFAAILVAVGIIALIYGALERAKAGRVLGAPFARTSAVANGAPAALDAKGMTSVEGEVRCEAPLTSPVTGTPCLYFHVKTTATWKDGEATKTREVGEVRAAAPFWLDDGSGPVAIDASSGGDFEPTQRREQNQSTGLVAGVTGRPLLFGAHEVPTHELPIGAKFYVAESVLPVVPRLYACGKLVSGRIAAPGFRSLILSAKSRDDLLASAQKASKIALAVGAAAVVVGTAIGVASRAIAPAGEASPSASAVGATKSTAATAKPVATPPKPGNKK